MDQRTYPMWCDANDGGVKRGDRASTGDLEARSKEGVGRSGSHVPPDRGVPSTGAADALAETVDQGALEEEDILEQSSLDPLDTHDPRDPVLGFTNTGDIGPDDWAADTGATQSAEVAQDDVIQELPEEPAASPKPSQRASGKRPEPKSRRK